MGVSPPPLGSPQCDNPREGNNSTITLRRGGPGGQALSPPSKHVSFLFCAGIKGILKSQNIQKDGEENKDSKEFFQEKKIKKCRYAEG